MNAMLFIARNGRYYHSLSTVDWYIMSCIGYNPRSWKDSAITYQTRRIFHKPVRERKPFAAVATEEGNDGGSKGHMLCVTGLQNTQPLMPIMELA